jgi:hypothetical protein
VSEYEGGTGSQEQAAADHNRADADHVRAGENHDQATANLENQETLEELLMKCINAVRSLVKVVAIGFGCTLIALVVMGVVLFIVWDDNEQDNLHSCQRGNSRAKDLVSLTDKVQDIVGGPGQNAEIDELAKFGREQFVARDCTGDGFVSDADYPAGDRAG